MSRAATWLVPQGTPLAWREYKTWQEFAPPQGAARSPAGRFTRRAARGTLTKALGSQGLHLQPQQWTIEEIATAGHGRKTGPRLPRTSSGQLKRSPLRVIGLEHADFAQEHQQWTIEEIATAGISNKEKL